VIVLAEKGLPHEIIMAQVGHSSREMLRHYSHIWRQALNTAAAAPSFSNPAAVDAELVTSLTKRLLRKNKGTATSPLLLIHRKRNLKAKVSRSSYTADKSSARAIPLRAASVNRGSCLGSRKTSNIRRKPAILG